MFIDISSRDMYQSRSLLDPKADPPVALFGTNITASQYRFFKNHFRIGKRWQKTEQTTIS